MDLNGHPALSDIEFRGDTARDRQRRSPTESAPDARHDDQPVRRRTRRIPDIPERSSSHCLAKVERDSRRRRLRGHERNGIRETPGGVNFQPPLAVRTDRRSAPVAEFVSGWLDEIGIGTTLKPMNDDAYQGDRQQRVRPLPLGLDARRRSDPMLSWPSSATS
jgi:hypothetical protein